MGTQDIKTESNKLPASDVLAKGFCTGCSSCVSICPKNALSFTQDEYGYYVPKVDTSLCNQCGLCQRSCPALNFHKFKNSNKNSPDLYVVKISDKAVLKRSTSGGVFSLLAEKIIGNKGYVSGAAWTDDLHVKHIIVDKLKDVDLLRKSKYMQSFILGIFPKIEELLKQGSQVLFSGCPCQVAGLKYFLRKDYSNFITVDLLCGNAPSSKFFEMYLNESYDDKPLKYEFRSKDYGAWFDHSSKVLMPDGTEVGIKKNVDLYQKTYHPHILCPLHCEKCMYQSLPRVGDITIGDFWGIRKHIPDLVVDDGVSAVLINSVKGSRLFDSIDAEKFDLKRSVPLEWLGGNGYALKGKHNYAAPGRNRFYSGIKKGLSFKDSFDNALKIPSFDKLAESRGCVSKYDSSDVKVFKFDPEYWEEHNILGDTYLFARFAKSPARKFARFLFDTRLLGGHTYRFYIKFKVSTDSKVVNFHVMDSGTKKFMVIHRHTVAPTDSEKFVLKEFVFFADLDFDSFMIGAAQITGSDPWFAMQKLIVLEDECVY